MRASEKQVDAAYRLKTLFGIVIAKDVPITHLLAWLCHYLGLFLGGYLHVSETDLHDYPGLRNTCLIETR